MSFLLINYEAQKHDKENAQYNGRVAITLGWCINSEVPYRERYIIITPLLAEDYPGLILDPPITSSQVYENTIRFYHYTLPRPWTFITDGYPTFTERVAIKPPKSKADKWGERKVYAWHWGKWIIDHYEKVEAI